MKWGLTNEEYMDRLEAKRQWHDWFAWRPVTLTNGQVAWLETVSRRWATLDELYASPRWVYAGKDSQA